MRIEAFGEIGDVSGCVAAFQELWTIIGKIPLIVICRIDREDGMQKMKQENWLVESEKMGGDIAQVTVMPKDYNDDLVWTLLSVKNKAGDGQVARPGSRRVIQGLFLAEIQAAYIARIFKLSPVLR